MLALGRVGRRHDHEPGDAVAVVEREAHDGVRAHRGAGEHGALDPAVVEHGEQVGGERLVAVVAGSGAGDERPWPRAS